MLSVRTLSLFTLLALVAARAPAPAEDRPTLDDYKWSKEEEQMNKDAAAAKQAKMSSVDKVIEMLDNLQAEVMADGEKEAAAYEKFACFCKDSTSEKSAAIDKGQDNKASLTSEIETLSEERDNLDTLIANTLSEIAEAQAAMKAATDERKKTLAVYEENKADLAGAIEALRNAIDVLKSSKSPSFAQMQTISETVRSASLMADALGLSGAAVQKAAAMFLQQDPVPMENYKFHSDGIIDTLEELLKDFITERNDVDAAEVNSVAAYEAVMQEKTDYVKAKNSALEQAKSDRATKISDIAAANSELSTVSAAVLDDQTYLAELTQMCTDKAKTYDQRSQVRADELQALTAATDIIKASVTDKTTAATVRLAQQGLSVRRAEAVAINQDSMENLEAAAEAAEAAPAFFQQSKTFLSVARKQSSPGDARTIVLDLLRTEGQKLKSTVLTSLATKISALNGADPFAKVKVLIQELITRLLQESANEANQKGWCDKATADATQKRDYAAEEIDQLNSQMAKLEARIEKLEEELYDLGIEILQLQQMQQFATMTRNSEKAENEQIVSDAQAGVEAVSQAIDILFKFYATSKKATVELQKGPADDAPDAGFKNFEAYTGKQGQAEGITGMMEVIKSDFQRTITETEKAEAAAEKDYLAFMTETGKSIASKQEAEAEAQRQKNDADEKFGNAKESLDSQTAILKGAISELMELKPTCIDTGMSYAERVARREEEIEALNKALCILSSYEKYGPDGAAEGC